jgi:hypothetical protein
MALSQALRARLRSHRPSGTLGQNKSPHILLIFAPFSSGLSSGLKRLAYKITSFSLGILARLA